MLVTTRSRVESRGLVTCELELATLKYDGLGLVSDSHSDRYLKILWIRTRDQGTCTRTRKNGGVQNTASQCGRQMAANS